MEDIIKWLCILIDFNTTMDTGNTSACAAFIRKLLRDNNIKSKIIEYEAGKAMLIAELPGCSGKELILHAHLDTAPYGSGSLWRFQPDKAAIKRGCICGRGALDCKSQAAVWLRIMCDMASMPQEKRKFGLRLILSADEENGGADGMKRLMAEPGTADDTVLAIGEGGGFPLPYKGSLLYTFQTGEKILPADAYDAEDSKMQQGYAADAACHAADTKRGTLNSEIIEKGIEKGYYSELIREYMTDSIHEKRRIDILELNRGMESFFDIAEKTDTFARYGSIFENALRKSIPCARLFPVITPGSSDNMYLRGAGIPTIGFFPLDIKNGIYMHEPNEYVSIKSLELAYMTLSEAVRELILRENPAAEP